MTHEVATLDPLVQQLVQARRAAGLSIRETARRSGVSYPMVWSIEHGQRVGTLLTLDALARVYGARITLIAEDGWEVLP